MNVMNTSITDFIISGLIIAEVNLLVVCHKNLVSDCFCRLHPKLSLYQWTRNTLSSRKNHRERIHALRKVSNV